MKLVFEAGGFLRHRAARHSARKLVFPGSGSKVRFLQIGENDLLQILQYKGLETPVSSPSTMV
jgi:hypothetical protein